MQHKYIFDSVSEQKRLTDWEFLELELELELVKQIYSEAK